MSLSIAEVLEALPEESTESPAWDDQTRLKALYAELASQAVPTSAPRRLWSLGGLKAQIALAYAAWWLRGWFQHADARQKALLETHLRAAIKLLGTMGYLRGAIMKLGQWAAHVPSIVPDEVAQVLDRLHFEAPPMHYALLREYLHDELGGDPHEIFAEFDTAAFAAASLGQVHRARLKTGEQVAVKIQYPGIGRTIRADFRSIHALMAPLRLTKDWESVKGMVEDVRRIMELETDYLHEAETQRRARELFHEDDGIVVPQVYEPFTTRRVLTMEFLSGRHLNAYLAENPSQAQRDAFGAKAFVALSRLFFAGRWNYADPNPGNFLFMDDGRLGLLDFGCLRRYNDDEWDFCREYRQAINGPREAWIRLTRRGAMLGPDEDLPPEHAQLLLDFMDWCAEPYWCEGAFDFGQGEYLRRGVTLATEISRRRYTRTMPMSALISRYYFSFNAFLYRLGARVPCKAIADDEARVTGWDEAA